MLVAAAVCPCPPLLVPEVAGGAAAEMDQARAACYDTLGVLAAARPDLLCVLGPAEPAGRGPHPQGARGTLAGFGVPLEVSLGKGEPARRELPPSLTVGAWLLERTDWTCCPVEGLGIGEPLSRDRCQEAGRELAARADRVALLVMGDGSNCRTLKAPGYFDERAAAFDAETARALAEADTAALLALDEELAYELKAAGRSSWQVLAGAGQGSDLAGKLLYDEAPYGVGYMVASWS
ncbi:MULTISPECIES: class III extradiol dioxygenase subunit B-like domain-containing protein [unclassified Streptomyces]|uniref:class III extradiol dioxygenase subunit B-like domain-containing protein n=1 Tax=unclassified Streptomyces TaxID=2593676 RepID=UPI0023EAA86C|nr:class III extradiol dioxygenase subunit B-like domain-containing protein [Streptomyces sp. WMMB303]MDF4253052.1 class III extradiol dioxygenase subunit B-like domain-containing protein [Streptomyces sp. WMMB303]